MNEYWNIIRETLKARATELAIAAHDAQTRRAEFMQAWEDRDYDWLAAQGFISLETLNKACESDD